MAMGQWVVVGIAVGIKKRRTIEVVPAFVFVAFCWIDHHETQTKILSRYLPHANLHSPLLQLGKEHLLLLLFWRGSTVWCYVPVGPEKDARLV
jgi:hypothetical protein